MYANLALLLSALSSAAPEAHVVAPAIVVAAAHEGELVADKILWRSTLLLERPADGALRVTLARPVDEVAAASTTPLTVERDEAGRVVALVVAAADLAYSGVWRGGALGRLDVTTAQAAPRGEGALSPVMPRGGAVQRVRISGAEVVRFTPAASLGVERRIGLALATDVDDAARATLEQLLPAEASVSADRIYLRAGDPLVDHGLVGVLERAPARRGSVALAAALAFCLVVVTGVALYRAAARQAEEERADAILEEEYRALG